MDSRNLLEYCHAVRHRYMDRFATLPWEEVTKDRGASFDSMKNILLHTLDAEDRMVNYVIPGRTKEWSSRNANESNDIASIRKRLEEVESKTVTYLARVTPAELERKVEVQRMDMPPVQVRVEDVLIHVALECIHHFGELIALMWQINIEPPHVGWIAYLQK
ncbi:MAG TPA: DinB family protein [Candidatus Bathyarchaeia archaeon]|nr:DinB family protein [Candidatus Bathyarchaeia archaeon]